MRRFLSILGVALLVLGLSACCMGSPTGSEKCKTISPGSCQAEANPMGCDMKAGCSCCSKSGATPQGHQH